MKIEVRSGSEAGETRRVAFEGGRVRAGELPRRILVAPWGEVRSRNGTFVVDEEAARLTLAAFASHGTDVPIDYEHQTLGGEYSAPNGLAPAAGWIKGLSVVRPASDARPGAEPPGLWADVEWTPEAAERLRGRAYRYLSPVALVRRSDRRMVGLHSAALTNKPAIARMPAVVNRACEAPQVGGWEELREMLALEDGAEADVVAVAAAERLRALQSAIEERIAADRVAAASAAGKLTAGQRAWALELALRDPAGFDEWLAHAPVVVALGRTRGPAGGERSDGREAVARRARAEYCAGGRLLAAICSEEAFVRDALREAGLDVSVG